VGARYVASLVAKQQQFVDDRCWPALTTERPTPGGGDAIHTRRCRLGRPLHNAVLTVGADPRPARNDPQESFDALISLPQSCRSSANTGT
jgi:hypothetical protein